MIGHPEDRFHDVLHICEGCGASVDESLGVVNRDRERVRQGDRACATCAVCGEFHADRSVLKLSDGKCLHADCFKCSQCGVALNIHDSPVKKCFTSKVQQCIAGTLICDACTPIEEAVAPPRAALDIGTSSVDAEEALEVMQRHSVSTIGAEQMQAQAPVDVAQAQDIYECAVPTLQGFREKARTEILQTSMYVQTKTSDLSVKANELLDEESISKVQECAAVIGERAQAVGASFWSGLRDLHRAATESFEEARVGRAFSREAALVQAELDGQNRPEELAAQEVDDASQKANACGDAARVAVAVTCSSDRA